MPLSLKGKNILVTGAAGFIGYSLVERFLKEKEINIIGIDNINSYYNPVLKQKRIALLNRKDQNKKWKFFKVHLKDKTKLNEIFEKYNPNIVVNLAAQAGVRYSLENPDIYLESNLLGFLKYIRKL